MPYLVAAVILIGALAVLNLVLSMGIIRRLREQGELLAAGTNRPADDNGLLAVGETVQEFAVTTVHGEQVTRADLPSESVVAFFSPLCGPCKERMPEFLAFAVALPAGQDRPIAVIVGEEPEATDMISKLSPVARVVTGSESESIVKAFGTTAFPAIYVMGRDGEVAKSSHAMSVVPALAGV